MENADSDSQQMNKRKNNTPYTKKNSQSSSGSPATRRSSSCSSPKRDTFSLKCQEVEDKINRKRPAKLTHFSMSRKSFDLKKSFSLSSLEPEQGTNEAEDIFFNSSSGIIYTVEGQIGKGNQAKVFKVFQKGLEDGQKLVAKVLYKSTDDESKSNLENEYKLLASLDHKNIIKAKSLFYDEKKKCLVLIEELAPGTSLRNMISTGNCLENKEKLSIMLQITDAVNAIHEKQIIHRDLTIDNIIYDPGTKTIKIIDFGLAAEVSKIEKGNFPEGKEIDWSLNKNFLMSAQGLPGYRAPEMLKGELYDEKIDIWMCGVIFIQLAKNTTAVKTKTVIKHLRDSGNLEKLVSKEFHFLEKILQISPGKRTSAKDMLHLLENNC